MGRGWFDSTTLLRLGVASSFGVLVLAAVIGEMMIVFGAFAVLLVGLRVERTHQAKRLHGYRRRRRR